MASRTRRWCFASGVLVRLTLTLSGLCASGRCAVTMPKECNGGALAQPKGEVRLAVIAPGDPHHEQSLPRVLPAVLLAVRSVSSPKGPLPGWNIKVDHRDSHCSSTYGPLAAFDFYINQTAGRTRCVFLPHLAFAPDPLSLFFFSFRRRPNVIEATRRTERDVKRRIRAHTKFYGAAFAPRSKFPGVKFAAYVGLLTSAMLFQDDGALNVPPSSD